MAELYKSKESHSTLEVNRLTRDNAEAVSIWCGGVLVTEHDALRHDITFAAINVPTVVGMKRAQEGDWIIQRLTGDFYPIVHERFQNLFEPVVNG